MILFSGIPEMVSATASVTSSGNALPRTSLVDITNVMDAYTATESDYVSVTGTMTRTDDYYNVVVDGASHICSITNTPPGLNLDAFVGKFVTLKGYYSNLDTYRNAHMLLYSSIEESPAAVDLGLPSGLKWASCNVGASTPEEYGGFFAWGETELKSKYTWGTYKWGNSYDKLTKYCTQSSYWDNPDPMDKKTVLDPEDDAAHVNWGDSWRMPTDAEWTELRCNCSWDWTTQNGVKGRLVTGPNGNSIFLPATGGRGGSFWSSSLDMDIPSNACLVAFNSSEYSVPTDFRGVSERCAGCSVRPVTE